MMFLSLVVVLALVQWWGSGAPVQQDAWFYRYIDRLQKGAVRDWPAVQFMLAVLLPSLVLWALCWLVAYLWAPAWLFFLAVPVLLYSLGRGDFNQLVQDYVAASEREDSVVAARVLAELQGVEVKDEDPEDWNRMHYQALKAIAYRGFERMFVVVFWFVLLGPAGALLYRLSQLYRSSVPSSLVERWVWLLEWPVVRLMGLTWSLAGNFDTCFFRCQRGLLNTREGAPTLLYDQILGALGVPGAADCDQDDCRPDASHVKATQGLLIRSLWVWLSVLALVSLLA